MWHKIRPFRTKQSSSAALSTLPSGTPEHEISHLVCSRCWGDIFRTEEWRNVLHNDQIRLEYRATELEIKKSAEDGCGWCRLALEYMPIHTNLPISIKSVARGPDVTPKGCRGLELGYFLPRDSLTDEPEGWDCCLDLHLFADTGDPAASFVPARPLRNDVHSPAAYEQIAGWLTSCKAHISCVSTGKDQALPVRLIQVTPTLRLVPTEGRKGRYVCLSYCWGLSRNSVLTRANFPQYHEKLEFEDLSRTIQDAIQVTRGIGIKYLWIDALCIVQDSEEDKDRNLAIMHSIYQNSLLTVVAARASNVEQGFLVTGGDKEASCQLPTVLIPVRRADGAWGTVSARHRVRCEFDEQKQPVNMRAWTLQETTLSPRLLVYNTHTMQWKCNEGTYNFGASLHIVPSKARNPKLLSNRVALRKAISSSSVVRKSGTVSLLKATAINGRSLMQELSGTWFTANIQLVEIVEWMHLIEAYTRREATRVEDKLPALGGIAALWPRAQPVIYLAGLWSFSMAVQLMWQVDRGHVTLPKRGAPLPKRRAPSWSWASVDRRVKHVIKTLTDLKGTTLYGTVIIGGHTTLKNANVPFGEVIDGVLRTQTSMCRCWYEPSGGIGVFREEMIRSSSRHPNYGLDDSDGHMWTTVDEDKDCVSRWVFCMPLLCRNSYSVSGLLLVPVGVQYRRIGCFKSGKKKDFELEPQQVIEII